MNITAEQIPQFDLYGEETDYNQPGFIHIEAIATRSRENTWVIAPHRHSNMLQILCMFAGDAEVTLDEERHKIEGSWGIIIPSRIVHGFHFSPETKGVVITLAEHGSAGDFLSHHDSRRLHELVSTPRTISVKDDTHLKALRHYSQLITEEFNAMQAGHSEMLGWQLRMLLMTLARQQDQLATSDQIGEQQNALLAQFKHLLDSHYRSHWNVADYATAMNISVSTLNRLCKKHQGEAVKTLIQNRVLIAIKRRLIYTREPLDQIGYRLGFKDPAYFSRFFKKQVGVSPTVYRQRHDRE